MWATRDASGRAGRQVGPGLPAVLPECRNARRARGRDTTGPTPQPRPESTRCQDATGGPPPASAEVRPCLSASVLRSSTSRLRWGWMPAMHACTTIIERCSRHRSPCRLRARPPRRPQPGRDAGRTQRQSHRGRCPDPGGWRAPAFSSGKRTWAPDGNATDPALVRLRIARASPCVEEHGAMLEKMSSPTPRRLLLCRLCNSLRHGAFSCKVSIRRFACGDTSTTLEGVIFSRMSNE